MTFEHPSLLLRVSRRFREGMKEHELYEATRGVWALGPNRSKARYAMAVARGIVREAYRIESWHPAGTTPYESRRVEEEVALTGRWEFQGIVAEEAVRGRYLGADVSALLPRGASNPVTYAGM